MKLLLSAIVTIAQLTITRAFEHTELRMLGVQPKQPDTYLCTSIRLDSADEHFLVGFEPHASMHTAHHILLFGCEQPGIPDDDQELGQVWDCGEMSHPSPDHYRQAPTCASRPQIIYAWARDAPNLELPKGVGFRVGGDSSIQYLVMQVHYMHMMTEPDFSGITLKSTNQRTPKTAGTLLMVTGGEIAPHATENFETACLIDESVELHPFAFRTHTHKHGKMVSGWKVVEDASSGINSWTLIGEHDPMQPQMFYPVANNVTLARGDMIAARCTMTNNESHTIRIGSTGADEMCNLYVMYWVNGDAVLADNTCFSPGPPKYYWKSDAGLNHIPH